MAGLLLSSCAEQVTPDPAPVVIEEYTDPIEVEDQRGTEGEEDDSTRWDGF